MMERASETASEDRHSMCALKSPVNRKPCRWGVLLLSQAVGVWDAARCARSVPGVSWALALLGQSQKRPLPSLHPSEDTAQLCRNTMAGC